MYQSKRQEVTQQKEELKEQRNKKKYDIDNDIMYKKERSAVIRE